MRMIFGDFILRLIFLTQTGAGILGNACLLTAYASTSCVGCSPRPTHLIFINMAVANFLVLVFKGIPQIIFIWGLAPTLGHAGCKFAFYMLRVGRGQSLCITCLLSNFQAIAINPLAIGWRGFRGQAGKHVSVSCFLCWTFNLLVNFFVPIHIEGLQHLHNSTKLQDHGLCSSTTTRINAARNTILLTLPDIVFLGLVAGASAYMILVLYRHHQKVRHIHTFNSSPRLSPEVKATQSILLLACTFILCYLTNSVLTVYMTVFLKSCLWMKHAIAFLVACYPTLNPLILMLRDPQVPTFCSNFGKKQLLLMVLFTVVIC